VRSLANPTNFITFCGLVAALDYKPDLIGVTKTREVSNSSGQNKSLAGYKSSKWCVTGAN